MNIKSKQWVYYILSVTGIILILLACKMVGGLFQKQAVQSQSLNLPIVAANPYKTSVKRYIEAVGQCTASASVYLVPQVEGEIVKIWYPNGGNIKKDEVLFEIDNRTYAANLEQAKAQLSIDQAQLNLSQSQLRRSEELRTGNFVSQQEYDSYKANVAIYEGHVHLDKANCTLKNIDLEHCTLRAPFDGVLGKSSVDNRSFVSKGTQLALLNQMQPIYVDFSISEKYFQALQSASISHPEDVVVKASLLDAPTVTQEGKLVFIDNTIEKTTGSFNVRAAFANKQCQFWAGQAVDLKVYYESLNDIFLIPEGSIHIGNHGHFIYIVNDNGEAQMVQVQKGQNYNGWVVIYKGLTGNEKVIAESHPLLAPGAHVTIKSTMEQPKQL